MEVNNGETVFFGDVAFFAPSTLLAQSRAELTGNGRLRAETRANLPKIANVKNLQFWAAEGRVSRNLMKFLVFARRVFSPDSLSRRLTLPTAPLSISLMPEEYHGVQDPAVLGAGPAPDDFADGVRDGMPRKNGRRLTRAGCGFCFAPATARNFAAAD
jgi:hypothetical protein